MKPLVSVYCLTYNHEKYVKDTLEGFLNQRTSFPFEVFVHDDASTDGTGDIIREYAEKYPEIIKPIIQTENRYSKGIPIFKTYINPLITGKYTAVCEGDDYWCDPDKLQKQVDWMESHPDYVLCAHNSFLLHCSDGTSEPFNDIKSDRDFSFEEILAGGKDGRTVFHTSSILFRSEYGLIPQELTVKSIGDYPRYLYLATCGRVRCLADMMSVYRSGVPGAWTTRMKTGPGVVKRRVEHWSNFRQMLVNLNQYTGEQYSECINDSIKDGDFRILKQKGDLRTIKKEFPDLYASMSLIEKTKILIKRYFPKLVNIVKK